ncbi:hypothetical protein NM688_g7605 [Phlebia brevispora]|uniref:Uncharacterized protein n=1 Tax=Phlebia brevispora TaxID=194682 RepID=A0ACC1S3L1_9APHY|nr:hypothetical protein NM688_g7605 [Phlebia brevispora]
MVLELDQSVLWSGLMASYDNSRMGNLFDAALLPNYAAVASCAILTAQYAMSSVKRQKLSRTSNDENISSDVRKGYWYRHVKEAGGLSILVHKSVRMAGVLALFTLQVYSAWISGWTTRNMALALTMTYASILATWNVLASATAARSISLHLTVVTFSIWAYYAYRDVWPLMTFTLRPLDEVEGYILWVKVALSTFVGLIEPLFEPHAYIPIDPENPSASPSSEQVASIASLVFYTFVDPIIWLGYRSAHVSIDQLPPLCDYDDVRYTSRDAYHFLDPFSGAKKENPLWSIMKAFRMFYLIQAIVLIAMACCRMASPIGTNRLLSYLESSDGAVVKPWVWIVWLGMGPMATGLCQQLYIFLSLRQFNRAEGIITSLVFDHALRVRFKAEVSNIKVAGSDNADDSKGKTEELKKAGSRTKGKNLVGRINNHVTSDLSSIQSGRGFPLVLFLAPIQVVLSMIFLYKVLGWSSFVGFAVMILLLPVPAWVSKMINRNQKKKMKAMDARVQKVTEMMNALRMIKLFGWERRVGEQVSEPRENELKFIWRRKIFSLGNTIANHVIPIAHMVATYATYTLLMKRELSASVVFSSITAFNQLRGEMARTLNMMTGLIQGYVALRRIFDFLHNTELLDEFESVRTHREREQDASSEHQAQIGCGKAHFTWANEDTSGTDTPSRGVFRLRVEGDLVFKRGSFNLITGPTGSGKTSLLMALLKEMHYIPLGPDSWVNLPRRGGVAYAAQESWIQNDTIKGNILFGAPLDEERYNKGMSLLYGIEIPFCGSWRHSGGQKARVTLARAVYSTAELLLLDDVLAALTHNVALAGPLAEFVVSLGNDGQIASQGSISDVLAKDKELAEELERETQADDTDDVDEDYNVGEDGDGDGDDKAKPKDGKLVIAEEIQLGHVQRKSFMLFVGNLGGKWPWVFWVSYLLGMSLSELFDVLEMWWLGWWARQYAARPASEVSIPYYLGVYSFIVLLVILFNAYSTAIYAFASMRASRAVHFKLISALLGCTFRWLDITPISRVLTRCTQDTQAVDGNLAFLLNALMGLSIGMTARLTAIIFYTPTFIAPALCIAVFGGWLGQMYMKSQLSVKREMSNAKAPVVGVFSGAISGLVSLRAYGAQQAFKTVLIERTNRYIRAARSFWSLNRWVSVRIDALTAIFSASLAFYLVYGTESPNPSTVGFVLAMAGVSRLLFVHIARGSLRRVQYHSAIRFYPL